MSERHRQWSADANWKRLQHRAQTADSNNEIDRDLAVDSTIMRAHPHPHPHPHPHEAGAHTNPPAPSGKGRKL